MDGRGIGGAAGIGQDPDIHAARPEGDEFIHPAVTRDEVGRDDVEGFRGVLDLPADLVADRIELRVRAGLPANL